MKELAGYFSFKGRSSRLRYWRMQVLITLVGGVLWCAGFLLAEATGVEILSALGVVALLPLLWVALALWFRRLHDRNKSGWWVVPFYLAPLALAGVGVAFRGEGGEATAGLVALVELALLLWGFIEVGLLPGTPGKNRFGPDPKTA